MEPLKWQNVLANSCWSAKKTHNCLEFRLTQFVFQCLCVYFFVVFKDYVHQRNVVIFIFPISTIFRLEFKQQQPLPLPPPLRPPSSTTTAYFNQSWMSIEDRSTQAKKKNVKNFNKKFCWYTKYWPWRNFHEQKVILLLKAFACTLSHTLSRAYFGFFSFD